MSWIIYYIISTSLFVFGFVSLFLHSKNNNNFFGTIKSITFFISLSSVMLFFPIYYNMYGGNYGDIMLALLLSIHNTIRLFVVDGEFSFVVDNMIELEQGLKNAYLLLYASIFTIAPFLTFGFVLSFFSNVAASFKYRININREKHIFSDLNANSIILARSILRNNKNAILVFADVSLGDAENSYSYKNQANSLGAVFYKKDLLDVNYRFLSFSKKMCFYIIGENEDKNLKHLIGIKKKYRETKNTKVYYFSNRKSDNYIVNALSEDLDINCMVLKRINVVNSLVNHNLYKNGCEIIDSAVMNNNIKIISVIIVGFGMHGQEMLKELTWLYQFKGYLVDINVFDVDSNAESCFAAECSELMDKRFNNNIYKWNETNYNIKIHSGINAETNEFFDIIKTIDDPTFVFICMGNDDVNIKTAFLLSKTFKRIGKIPKIQTVVYNGDKCQFLAQYISNRSKENINYNVEFIGNNQVSYDIDTIENSEVEKEGEMIHKYYCDYYDRKEDYAEFWKNDSEYKSSISAAMHRRIRDHLNIADEEEKKDLEQRRWVVYQRTEGFIRTNRETDKDKNVGLTHPDMCPYNELSQEKQNKIHVI